MVCKDMQIQDKESPECAMRKTTGKRLREPFIATAVIMAIGALLVLFSVAGIYAQEIPDASVSEQKGQDFPGNYTTPGWLVLNGTTGTAYGTHGNFHDQNIKESTDWFRINLEPGALYNLSVRGIDLNYPEYGVLNQSSLFLIEAIYTSDDVNHSAPRGVQIANDAYSCPLFHQPWREPYSFRSVYCDTGRFSTAEGEAGFVFTAGNAMGREDREYYVLVNGRGRSTGSYVVTLEELSPAPSGDDHGNDDATSTVLSVGQNVTGRFEQTGDNDRFMINLTGGKAYLFQLDGLEEDNGGLLRNPLLELYGTHPLFERYTRLAGATRYSNYVDENGRVANVWRLAYAKSERTDTTAWLYFEATDNGTYYLDVSDATPASVPGVGYTLSVNETAIRG